MSIRTNFQILLNKINKQKVLDEAEVPVTIASDVLGTIDSKDSETIKNIKREVGGSNYRQAILDFLIGINVPEKRAREIFRMLSNSDDLEKISKYLLGERAPFKQFLGKKTDVFAFLQNLGIDRDAAQELFAYKTATSPATGPGEIFMSTFIEGGRRPVASRKEKGDVRINDIEVEVKAASGRLAGQSGYGDAKGMQKTLLKAIENISKEFSVKVPKSAYKKAKNGNNWHFGKDKGGEFQNTLIQIAKEIGGFDKKQIEFISKELVIALKQYYKDLDTTKLAGAYVNVINTNGVMDYKKLHYVQLEICYNYYLNQEHFAYLSLVNPSIGVMLIIKPSEFMKYVKNGTIQFNVPSYGDKAGAQGGTYGITVK